MFIIPDTIRLTNPIAHITATYSNLFPPKCNPIQSTNDINIGTTNIVIGLEAKDQKPSSCVIVVGFFSLEEFFYSS